MRLRDGLWVNPREIAEISLGHDDMIITIRMKLGNAHYLGRDVGRSGLDTVDRLVGELLKERDWR